MASRDKKLIVVTGATRGLGRAMVARFCELGHTVVGCGRSEQGIADLQKYHPAPHHFSIVDVAEDSEVHGWSQSVLEHLGPPDLLINNAAIINHSAKLWEIGADEFRRVLEINVIGVANCVRAFVPSMVARRSGVIVNFSSSWGRSVSAEVAPYCATKWAIEGLTQSLARELPSGMAAVPLNPGVINTDMLQSCFGDGAGGYPDAERWSRAAAPYILRLNAGHNGQPLSVEGF